MMGIMAGHKFPSWPRIINCYITKDTHVTLHVLHSVCDVYSKHSKTLYKQSYIIREKDKVYIYDMVCCNIF